jgi:malonate transporter MadL subunit
MTIYGVALLAFCFLVGQGIGMALGELVGVDGNVGGVAFSMILLILLHDRIRQRGYLSEELNQGILFWNAMYIPVVVAMSSTQHVKAALQGGWVALVAGLAVTAICFSLIPLVSRLDGNRQPESNIS